MDWKSLTNILLKKDIFMKNLKDYQLDIHAFPERIKHIRNIIQKNLFSICFCENALNETLWLKYANNYKGFAFNI